MLTEVEMHNFQQQQRTDKHQSKFLTPQNTPSAKIVTLDELNARIAPTYSAQPSPRQKHP